jgi:hypothetical protein
MILTLDTMAERYKMLPSQVIRDASTFDLYIMDAAISYHNHQQRKLNGQSPELSTDELMEIMKKAKQNG